MMPPTISVTPQWLDESFVREILDNENSGPSSLEVIRHVVTPAINRGDNFISDLYRVVIETSDTKKRSVIVKCLPTAEYNLKFIRDACLFEKEISFYRKILPEMSGLLKVDGEESLTPTCLHIHSDFALVLEDLVPLGYEVVDRRVGLDLQHCSLAVKSLARLHAMSTGLPAEELASLYPDTVYSGRGKAHAVSYITNSIMLLASRVEKWPGFEKFGSKLRDLAPRANDRVLAIFESPSFRVLNHGDFWTNNIMFRYSSTRELIGIKIIDFQMCRFVSPSLDLLNFFYTNSVENIREVYQEQLLEEYYSEFCKYICLLGKVPTLTMDQLRAEMERNAFFGFISACLMLPVVLADPEEVPDLGKITTRETELECHAGLTFQFQFQKILLQFEKKGII